MTTLTQKHYAAIADDRDVLKIMQGAIAQALKDALVRCAPLAAQLTMVTGDHVLAELKAQFDPADGTITDLFSDGFALAEEELGKCEQWGPSIAAAE